MMTLLPLLTNFQLQFFHTRDCLRTISLVEFIKLIEHGIQIEQLKLNRISNLLIDQTVFESILNAMQNRCAHKILNIQITGCHKTEDIQKENYHRLRITYESYDCNVRKCRT